MASGVTVADNLIYAFVRQALTLGELVAGLSPVNPATNVLRKRRDEVAKQIWPVVTALHREEGVLSFKPFEIVLAERGATDRRT